jgi:hypothetical protein
MADNNYPLPVLDAASGELRCPPGFVVTQPAGQGVARSEPYDMLVRGRVLRARGAARSALTRARPGAPGPAGAGLRNVLHGCGSGGSALQRG